MAGSNGFDAEELVGDRRDEREERLRAAPPRLGRHRHRGEPRVPLPGAVGVPGEGLPQAVRPSRARSRASAPPKGVIEGTARVVLSPEQFAQVERDEIVICRMTSPAWVVLFTKIGGLVTDAGGMASHPAVVSREFGIPAVVGTSDATRQIKTGDRVRVNGATGVVQVLA